MHLLCRQYPLPLPVMPATMSEKQRKAKKRKAKQRKEKKRKEKKRKEKKRKEKKRQDYAFRRQFNEKPSIIPGCPEPPCHLPQPHMLLTCTAMIAEQHAWMIEVVKGGMESLKKAHLEA